MWLAVSPLMAAGILVAHAIAYRLTGTPAGSLHGYLEHAPQILLVVTVASLGFAGIASRLHLPSAWPFPVAALVGFVIQEHVERLAHTGGIPWLFDSRTFIVGVLLQLPVAFFTWALARRLLVVLANPRLRRPRLPHVLLEISTPATFSMQALDAAAPRSRAPPLLRTP